MSSVTIFKGTPSERTVTSEEVENLYKHALVMSCRLEEMLDARLNEAYNELYVLSETEMLEFAQAGDEYYGE